jgi:hypothetical protein
MKLDRFNQLIKKYCDIEKVDHDSEYVYNEHLIDFNLDDFNEANDKLNELSSQSSSEIHNSKYYEVSVQRPVPAKSNWFIIEKLFHGLQDHENKLVYSVGPPSNQFILFLLREISKLNLDLANDHLRLASLKRSNVHNPDESDVFGLIAMKLSPFLTIKVESSESMALSKLVDLAHSFMFQISYNTDLVLSEVSIVDHYADQLPIIRVRNSDLSELNPPRRVYNNNLIKYYQNGLSSWSADLTYLSFYHILEHFFSTVFDEYLVGIIKDKITSPGFSYNNDNHYHQLLKSIRGKHKTDQNSGMLNMKENVGLVLTLKRYVPSIVVLKDELNFKPGYLDYLRNNAVTFSSGDKVDLSSSDNDSVFKSIANRIYKTRNAIVHRKDQEVFETKSDIYIPFKHNKILDREVFFIRTIAELVLLNSSSTI